MTTFDDKNGNPINVNEMRCIWVSDEDTKMMFLFSGKTVVSAFHPNSRGGFTFLEDIEMSDGNIPLNERMLPAACAFYFTGVRDEEPDEQTKYMLDRLESKWNDDDEMETGTHGYTK